MKKVEIHTTVKKLLADVYTPVGIYLRLRDRFRDTILLESTDFHAGENSFSFIAINAIAGIEIRNPGVIEFKLPGQNPEKIQIGKAGDVPALLQAFADRFATTKAAERPVRIAQGLFGYTAYDAVSFFEDITPNPSPGGEGSGIPLVR
ncbi:MAG TPA: anthranilate synthase component I family protein, partial [Ferruginibacter sp.]|nr:anthranilate synthase component I family protein [Ferruginibacter sp.]